MRSDNYKKISIDIDGIMTDYPACWLKYLTIVHGIRECSSVAEARYRLGDALYEHLKQVYRLSEYKANLSLKDSFVYLYSVLKKVGYEICIATSRQLEGKPFQITVHFLEKNNISYVELINDKSKYYHIDG